jgi:hypothetical protein
MSESNKYKINGESAHPQRVPIHKQKALGAKERKGFKRRIVNDEVGRIEMFKLAGWKVVEGSEERDTDARSQNASQLGSEVRYVVNRDPNAKSNTAVLMEIPEEIYHEDYLAQQQEIKDRESALNPANAKQGGADYGTMQIDDGHRNK